jgi:hypothetical protein
VGRLLEQLHALETVSDCLPLFSAVGLHQHHEQGAPPLPVQKDGGGEGKGKGKAKAVKASDSVGDEKEDEENVSVYHISFVIIVFLF